MENKMIKQEILYSKGMNDLCYTPRYAIEPLLKYINKNMTIWMPFDTNDSEFVKLFKENGYKVINSDIKTGQNFYTYEPEEHWDCIISNPPFSGKKQIFERALSFNKPFLLLAPCTWFNDSALSKLFDDGKDMQVLFYDKRVKFLNDGIVLNKISYGSCFIGKGLLPRQIIFEKIYNK